MPEFAPCFVTAKDDQLLGSVRRADGMGFLAVWSDRARDLVPHLTEQTTSLRGFQILVTAFYLWEEFERTHRATADDLPGFFLVVEQVFARLIARRRDGVPWEGLPGTRRVNARRFDAPHASLADGSWHLMQDQRATGLWGLYRGAAGRAGILNEDLRRLSDASLEAATTTLGHWGQTARHQLFEVVAEAFAKKTPPLAGRRALSAAVQQTFDGIPTAAHLEERLIRPTQLNELLAGRLREAKSLDHRSLLSTAATEIPEFEAVLRDAIRCEELLAVIETAFDALCASNGKTLGDVASALPLDLPSISHAKDAFEHAGTWRNDAAKSRHRQLCRSLDVSSTEGLLRSVLAFHESVSEDRGTALWVWEDTGFLRSEVPAPMPAPEALQVGVSWRNDYYLAPLRGLALQLAGALADELG